MEQKSYAVVRDKKNKIRGFNYQYLCHLGMYFVSVINRKTKTGKKCGEGKGYKGEENYEKVK